MTSDSHFAWLRTRLAVERTLLSWIRTAASLIGFGFAIVQFFDRLGAMPQAGTARLPEAPKYLGLAMIFCGVISLFISIWQYRSTVRYLRSGSFAAVAGVAADGAQTQTPAIAVAVLLSCIGLFAFCAVLLRLA
ncbi:MAG: YidH family protein [Geminicoccaceae bacterium]